MAGFIMTLLVGIVCIILGVSNYKGNIDSLHFYHRKRVSEEDRVPFGRMVGRGMIIIGSSIIFYGGLSIAALFWKNQIFIHIGTGLLVAGLVIGLVISFYAMIKYNKGIF